MMPGKSFEKSVASEIYEVADGDAVRVDAEDIVPVGWELCCFDERNREVVATRPPKSESREPLRSPAAAFRCAAIDNENP